MITCSKCSKIKPATSEYFGKQNNGNFARRCKDCDSEYKKEWQEKNKARISSQRKKFREANRDRINADKIKAYEANKEQINAKLRERNRLKRESIPIPTTKTCAKCNRELPRDSNHFWKHKNSLFSRCKECMGTPFGIHVLNKQYSNNEYKYCSVCREILPKELFSKDGSDLSCRCKECQRKRYKKYYGEHREGILVKAKLHSPERHRIYYLSHKQEYKEYGKRRRENNPDLYRSYVQKRLALKRGLPSTLTPQQWEQCKNHFNNHCAYCNSDKPLTQDHFIALSKFGEYSSRNIIPACGSCNPSKSNKPFSTWYPKQPFYSKSREKKILSYLGYSKGIQQLSLM